MKKIVLITGGSSGIGAACAKVFLAAGFGVAITGRDEQKLIQIQKEYAHLGTLLLLQGDVGDQKTCEKWVQKTIETFGRLDILINNAGISMRAVFADLDLRVFEKLMQTNFFGTVYMTKAALSFLLQNQGMVVGISSTAGKLGLPARTAYSASKFAMEGFLEALRCENLHMGLQVLLVCPSFTASNIRLQALTSDGTAQGYSPQEENKITPASEVAQEIFEAVVKGKKRLILGWEEKLAVFLNFFFPDFIQKKVFHKMSLEKNHPLFVKK